MTNTRKIMAFQLSEDRQGQYLAFIRGFILYLKKKTFFFQMSVVLMSLTPISSNKSASLTV